MQLKSGEGEFFASADSSIVQHELIKSVIMFIPSCQKVCLQEELEKCCDGA